MLCASQLFTGFLPELRGTARFYLPNCCLRGQAVELIHLRQERVPVVRLQSQLQEYGFGLGRLTQCWLHTPTQIKR